MQDNNSLQSNKRYGFIGIIVPTELKAGRQIQAILEKHAQIILGRLGLPHLDNDRISVITLIIRADSDELGSLTGQLGRIRGVTVKSGMAKAGTGEMPDSPVLPGSPDAQASASTGAGTGTGTGDINDR